MILLGVGEAGQEDGWDKFRNKAFCPAWSQCMGAGASGTEGPMQHGKGETCFVFATCVFETSKMLRDSDPDSGCKDEAHRLDAAPGSGFSDPHYNWAFPAYLGSPIWK